MVDTSWCSLNRLNIETFQNVFYSCWFLTGRFASSCHNCTGCTSQCTSKRGITTNITDSAISELKAAFQTEFPGSFYGQPNAQTSLQAVKSSSSRIEVTFTSGEKSAYPLIWLRDNCQCHSCFDPKALGRSLLWNDLNLNLKVSKAELTPSGDLEVIWDDGHVSSYSAAWLQERTFDEQSRKRYRLKYQLPKVSR